MLLSSFLWLILVCAISNKSRCFFNDPSIANTLSSINYTQGVNNQNLFAKQKDFKSQDKDNGLFLYSGTPISQNQTTNAKALSNLPEEDHIYPKQSRLRSLQVAQTSQPKTNETDDIQALADYNTAIGNVVTAGVLLEQFTGPGASSTVSTTISVNMIQYVRYININYPKDLENLYKKQGLKTVTFNFGFLFPANLKPIAQQYQPPSRFSLYQITGLFLVNYWKTVITIPTLLLATVVLLLIGKINIKNSLFIKIYITAKNFLVWNFLISFVLSNVDALTIWSIVEFQSLRLDSPLSIISFIINITLSLASFLLLTVFTRRAYHIGNKEKFATQEEKVNKHVSTKVLFEELKDKHVYQQLFFLITVLRIVISNLIVAIMSAPLLQCSLLLTINIIMTLYLALARPYVQLLKNIELFCYELVDLVVNIACIRLSVMGSDEQRLGFAEADAIIKSNVSMSSISLFFTILKIGLKVFEILKKKFHERKKLKAQVKNVLENAKNVQIKINQIENEENGLQKETRRKQRSLSHILTVDNKVSLAPRRASGVFGSRENFSYAYLSINRSELQDQQEVKIVDSKG